MTPPAPRDTAPTLAYERSLLGSQYGYVIGMDEVGRGALAGPVSVGVAAIGSQTAEPPVGLRDSKLIRPALREQLVPLVQQWAVASAVGHASAAEIDEHGIIGGLRLAGMRALGALDPQVLATGIVLLDGSHDWLTKPPADLFAQLDEAAQPEEFSAFCPPVVTRVKGDMTCAAVAGASVLAKCARDQILVELDQEFPQYGWANNKGYASGQHVATLQSQGASRWHRRSWKLPGLDTAAG